VISGDREYCYCGAFDCAEGANVAEKLIRERRVATERSASAPNREIPTALFDQKHLMCAFCG
jgi:hypothetical protein